MDSSSNTTFALFLLLHTPGVGPARLNSLIHNLRSKRKSLISMLGSEAERKEYLNEQQIRFIDANHAQLENEWRLYQSQNLQFISILESTYPARLAELLGNNAPPLLSIRGNRKLLASPSIGFCGSRKASEKGLHVASECAEALSEAGINVVSGYAQGVDMATHKAALAAGGTTTIVLPEGLQHFTLKRDLKDVWDWNRVLVVSEFLPTAKWSVGNAMRRNSTIITLSHAMILIEARNSGGSYAAGLSCIKLGLPLFSIDYEGSPETAEGNRILLERGAESLGRIRGTLKPNIHKVLHLSGLVQNQEEILNEASIDHTASHQLALL